MKNELNTKNFRHCAVFGDAASFAAIPHDYRANYWFVFYSEPGDAIIKRDKEWFSEENLIKVTS